MSEFREKLNKYTDRKQLISHIKYLKAKGVIKKAFTKGKETSELVYFFLNSVEEIAKQTDLEREIVVENQPLVIMYNDLAAKVENDYMKNMPENFSVETEKIIEVPKEVQVVKEYGHGNLVKKSKKKDRRVTKSKFEEENNGKDLFGNKIGTRSHKISALMVAGMSKGKIKSKLDVQDSDVKTAMNKIEKKGFEISKKGIKDNAIYKIYAV